MLKNILNIKGIQQLEKAKQKQINGGEEVRPRCPCMEGWFCAPSDRCYRCPDSGSDNSEILAL